MALQTDSLFEKMKLDLERIKAILCNKLRGKQLPQRLIGLEDDLDNLIAMMRRSLELGESNSALIVGARGSGKTALVNLALKSILDEKALRDKFITIHLNGLIQTDDSLAINEICYQLNVDAPEEVKTGSSADRLHLLLNVLQQGSQSSSKTILFILDEFDLLAQHQNQSLLYNLFDSSQNAQCPILIIGVTCRLDVVELLEKRVRSRFSHRQIHLLSALKFDQYQEAFVQWLSVEEGGGEWNEHVVQLAKDSTIRDLLLQVYTYSRNMRTLIQLLTYPVAQLSEQHATLQVDDFVTSFRLMFTDSKASLLTSLSVLELCLIVAAKHLTEIFLDAPFTFEALYHEYEKFTIRRSSVQRFGRAVVLKAFENLLTLQLLVPVDRTSSTKTPKDFRPVKLLVDPSQVIDTLHKYPHCPTELRQWATNSLHS